MTTLKNIEKLLKIDLSNKQLRDGKKRSDKNKFYWFSKKYYIVKLQGFDNWCVMSSNKNTRELLRKYIWYSAPTGYVLTTVYPKDEKRYALFLHKLIIDIPDNAVITFKKGYYDIRNNSLSLAYYKDIDE